MTYVPSKRVSGPMASLRNFLRAEQGAVTVDWTVLGAAVVGLGIATAGAVRTGVVDLGVDIDASLSGVSVTNLGTLGGDGWAFTSLYVDNDWMHGPGGYIAQMTNWNYSASQMQSIYNAYANAAQRYLNEGNDRWARLYVDHMYAASQVLNNLGSAPLPGSADLRTVYDQVVAM